MNAKNWIQNGRKLGRIGLVCAAVTCAAPVVAQNDQAVEVTDYGTVTLAVQDTDLAQVLEMLSIQSQKNIITSKNVSATISANLYDVTFYEALDAILKVNGYDYVEEGNFIYIYTQAEMEAIEASTRKTESRIFKLNNLSATDASELIAPLLSEQGRSSFRGDVQPGIETDTSDVGQDNWAFGAMLVVNDFQGNLDAIASLLEDLDVSPKQVLIEATILQTQLDESNAFGIDFSVLGNVDFTDLANPLSGVNNLLSGSDQAAGGFQPADNKALIGGTTVGGTAGPGGLKIGIVKDDISVFLRVLDEVTDAVVLARPKLMCLNRQRAEVLVGRRVGYLSSTATETSTTQTVEFLDTGINLMFRPFISANNMIRIEMSPSVSEAFLRNITNQAGQTVTIPDELTNELTTNVRIQDGHTLVLGGLFRESTNITRRQVPLLGDIPILGNAFRGQDDRVDRDEIMFLITPTILHDEEVWALGDETQKYAEAVQVGARKGLLPFSQEKTSEQQNARALEAFNAGDHDLALFHINNSLRINPNQPEIVRFRDRITGTKSMPHERSILNRVYREQMGTLPVLGSGAPGHMKPVTTEAAWSDPATGSKVGVMSDGTHGDFSFDRAASDGMTSFEDPAAFDTTGSFDGTTSFETPTTDFSESFTDEVFENNDVIEGTTAVVEPPVAMERPLFEETAFETPASGSAPRRQPAPTPASEPTPVMYPLVEVGSNTRDGGRLHPPITDLASGGSFSVTPAGAAGTPTATGFIGIDATGGPAGTSTTLVSDHGVAPAAVVTADDDRFVDRFISEYFSGLGLTNLSPYDRADTAQTHEGSTPFATFDDIVETSTGDSNADDNQD